MRFFCILLTLQLYYLLTNNPYFRTLDKSVLRHAYFHVDWCDGRLRNFCLQSCAHGTDKDVYMSIPCVLYREGVYAKVRQELNDQEKTAVQQCADSIRGMLRECGILLESSDVEE